MAKTTAKPEETTTEAVSEAPSTKSAALKTLKEKGIAAAIRQHPDHEEALNEAYEKVSQ